MWALYILLAAFLTAVSVVATLYALRIRLSRRLVARTIPAQSFPAGCRKTIVVAGDSTAFGVGALPAESTAGRIAAAYPHARVVNVAKSGARMGHVVDQLNGLDIRSADLILIHACANDVLEFRSVKTVERDLRSAIARARMLSDNVILMPGQNFSVAPFFLRPISRIIMWHAVRVHAMVQRVSAELGVIFVDLFLDPNDDPFVREPRRYYCPDGLHPSGEGYAIWFATLLAQAPLERFLADL
ncbi:MAG TPA: SGNH/GDSL hydrolase family protein [Burkholderiales bacterium]|nr:SGNH/GDSL hydrolase family protein [Burkholderiales bacterium]HUP09003.1 SGNH/GDSL hydrolase family protein [Caldimonas sp.]